MKRNTVIVDLSGTVADTRHRLHHVRPKDGSPKNYEAYNAGIPQDAPIMPVVNLVRTLAYDNNIVFVTDRKGKYHEPTIDWLDTHSIPYDELHMRNNDDDSPAPDFKRGVLEYLRGKGHKILLAIEDLPHIAEMWRANGVHCLQTQALN